ncbi:MAG: ATP-dependent DNA helicase [Candidatus Omnitrophota bacterium]
MNKVLEGLNQEQIEAVTHKNGPLLIIAGAGTGKTTMITRRIAWIIYEGLAKTNEILALTFTDKAANQMLNRVDILVPYGYTDIWISTFHAFSDRLLRENSVLAGLDSDFKVLTRPEAVVFLRERLFEFQLDYFRPLSSPTRFIEAMVSLFSRAKDEDISPSEYLAYAGSLMRKSEENPKDEALAEEASQQMEIALAYAKYQELLLKEGVVDFGNQFYLGLELLRKHPLVLKKYQEQFKYILVDEFQDTNYAQFQMIKLLAQGRENITVTGDDDQCIYRFRGAAYSNLINFMSAFPKAKSISIIMNYRSSQPILESAYRLIQNNNPDRFEVKSGINKRLVSSSGQGEGPKQRCFEVNSSESDWVAEAIAEKVKSAQYAYRDFAILVRSNADAQSYLQALNMQAIPWKFSGNQGLYSREEVKLCIHFLRFTANPFDSLSLYYLCSSEIYKLNLSDLSLCMHYAKSRNRPLYSVFKNVRQLPQLSEVSEETHHKIDKLLSDSEKFLKIANEEPAGRLLYSFLTDTGYLKKLTHDINLEKETKIQNIARFFNKVRDFELAARDERVVNFVNYLGLLMNAGDDPESVDVDPDADAVNVLTIHKAKGLEFKVVFMVNLVNGRFPVAHRKQIIELADSLIKEALPSGDFHLQEERRLFYVGMTRAKEELYFTSSADYGGLRLRKRSQFVIEALGEEAKIRDAGKESSLEKIKRFAPRKEPTAPGEPDIAQDELLNLSFYQIDDYLTCPLKYKYVHILRVPIMEHHTVVYGRAMHEAVTKYFKAKIEERKMGLSELLGIFQEGFDPQGFLDEKHEALRLEKGKEALASFYQKEEKAGSRPEYIEKEFSFSFENNKIRGRFDRIDMEGTDGVIIDFKTSELTKQKDADKRAKESLQLAIYALAYKDIYGKIPKREELYFLESGLIGKDEKKEEDLEKAKEKIREVSRGLRRRIFEAKPEYLSCLYCAYNQVCPKALLK